MASEDDPDKLKEQDSALMRLINSLVNLLGKFSNFPCKHLKHAEKL